MGNLIPHYNYISPQNQIEIPAIINTQLNSILKKTSDNKVEFNGTEDDSVFDDTTKNSINQTPKKSQVFYHSSVTTEL